MANKSTTIKTATDKELDELLVRLRKENELQNLIGYIKRKSGTIDPLDPYAEPKVSTEEPIESMYHFGIPGMKWGRRRGKSSQSISPKTHYENNSEDHNNKLVLGKKKLKQMSNKEIRDFNERIQLERQYSQLTKTEQSAGRKFVTEVLSNAAKQTATTYTNKYMNKAVEELIKKLSKTG